MCIVYVCSDSKKALIVRYEIVLRYFAVMSMMLIGSGFWMFLLHTSMSLQATIDYYAPKSLFGLLETVSPHLFGMGLFVFVTTHFFAVIKKATFAYDQQFAILFFGVVVLENIAGFLITKESILFASIKLFCVVLFVILSAVSLWRVWRLR